MLWRCEPIYAEFPGWRCPTTNAKKWKDLPAKTRTYLKALAELTGARPAEVISDSHGRAWREGTVGTAIGVAGLAPIQDLRGHPDLFGYQLQYTTVGFADQVAAAASLVMGQAGEGLPVVLVRGLVYQPDEDVSARQILRPPETDVFR